MKGPQSIDFVLRGRVDGVEITPATIGLSHFNEFNRQVEEFVGGSGKLPLDEVRVHIRLSDSGKLVHVRTDQNYLRDQEENRLYRKVLVRVEAEQHHSGGDLRNLRLLSFEDYAPHYDEDALDRFASAGRDAWVDVSEPRRAFGHHGQQSQ
ncbi:MAG: hypothetical protein WCK77_01000 [Verrucomicrobiota bacterium]